MYSKYTMTFYDLLEWMGGWENTETRDFLFDHQYNQNKVICDVLMEAFKYWEIGYEIPGRFVHEFGEKFTRLLPEYSIRKKMWNELNESTELLTNDAEKITRSNEKKTNGSDKLTANNKDDVLNEATDNSSGTNSATILNQNLPGDNIDFTKNYYNEAKKDNNNFNNENNHNGKSNHTITKEEENIKENTDIVKETIDRLSNKGVTKFQLYELFKSITPERWFMMQFDSVFMQVF